MNFSAKKIVPQLHPALLFLTVFLAVWIDFKGNNPKFIVWLLPPCGILIIYHFALLLDSRNKVRRFVFSTKGILTLLYLLFCLGLTCTSTDELFKNELGLPLRTLRWLSVCLVGVLFAVSLLNFCLSAPEGLWLKIVQGCKLIWRLPSRVFLLFAFLWVFGITNLYSWEVFEHIPHVMDSIAQFFQAKIFAQGTLTAPLPPLSEFFNYYYDNMIFTDRWYSQYPPGHSLLLMLGLFVGAPWIINPLLASFSVILLYKATRLYFGEQEARLAAILFCISPFVLFMSASFMNHVSALFFLLLFLYCCWKSQRAASGLYGLAAGFALGLMLNIRPPDAFVMGMLWGSMLFVWGLRQKNLKPFCCFLLAVLLMAGILLSYNHATNGDSLVFGYQVRWGRTHALGFTDTSLIDRPPHTPLRGLIHTLSNFIALNQNLFEWPLPALIPIIVAWLPFIFRKSSQEYLLLAGLLAAPVFYFFYFFQDLCLGPRFYYTSLPFVFALTARGIFKIIAQLSLLRGCPEKYVKNAVIALLFCSFVFAAFVRVPKLYRLYADSFWGVDNKLMTKARAMGIKNAVIFQKSYGDRGSGLGSGFLHNSPGLNDSLVFAKDLGERNKELITFFPGRHYYLATRTENGEVIIEPLPRERQK